MIKNKRRLQIESLEDRWLPSLSPTTTALNHSPSGSSIYGQSVVFTASVSDTLQNSVTAGTVDFSEGNVHLLSGVSLNSSGQASFTTALAAGSHPIAAAYSGTPTYASSSGSDTLTVSQAPLAITPTNQSMIYGGSFPSLTFSGNFVPGETAANLTTQPSLSTPATVSSPAGTYPIHANGAVDSNYTITYADGTFTITKDSTSTSVQPSSSNVAFGQQVTLSASVAPALSASSTETGSLAFYDGSTLLATVAVTPFGGAAVASYTTSSLSSGAHTLTAAYTGDANHTVSTSSGVTVTVGAPPPGVISGTVFHDYNTNGAQDAGEPRLGAETIFLDLDGSGQLKPADPIATTDANGNYQFTIAAGTYTVRQLLLGGVLQSVPANGYPVTLSSGANVSGQDFADVLTSISVPLTLAPTSAFLKQGSANGDYVEGLYRAILNRDADASGLANWTGLLNSGALSRLQVVQGIRNSPEHFTQEVSDFYLTLLNRQADPSGLQNWVQQLQNGMKEEQIAFYFLDSPEYLSQGDKHFVDAMYLSLLGRSFDSAGEANWLSQLGDDTSGNATHGATLTHEQVISAFLYSTESETRLTEGYYEVFLQRPADAAGLSGWVAQLQQGARFLTIGQQFLSSTEFYNRAAQQG